MEKEREGKPDRPVALISISIDLAGSTRVKQEMVNNSESDSEHRSALYENFRQLLFIIEERFYSQVELQKNVDLDQLFLVKTIGDEFWYVFPVYLDDVDELRRVSAGLISALLALFEKSNQIRIPSRPIGDEETLAELPDVNWTSYDLPLKASIDLIEDAIELNLERKEFFDSRFPTLLHGRKLGDAALRQKIVDLFDRLNIGIGGTLVGAKHRSVVRTDYIGLGVDRFFRISKHCKPRMLVVGEELLKVLDYEVHNVSTDYAHLNVKVFHNKVPHGHATGWTADRRQLIKQELSPHELKGVRDPYTIFHLFSITSLGSGAFLPMPYMEDQMDSTRGFLGEHGYYGIPRNQVIS